MQGRSCSGVNAVLDEDTAAFLLPPTIGFECGERVLVVDNKKQDDDTDCCDAAPPLPVTFLCSFSTRNNGQMLEPASAGHDHNKSTSTSTALTTRHELYFGCRRPSFGVLQGTEETVNDDENDEDGNEGLFDESAGDPNFFDKSYTLAGSTGFCVWAGARFMLDALVVSSSSLVAAGSNNEPLTTWQHRIAKGGARVLELGAGVGLLGTGLATAGAQVLMTDLPSLVEDAIKPNLRRNAARKNANNAELNDDGDDESSLSSPPEWLLASAQGDVQRIGKGWAAAMPLDWSKPLDSQISNPSQVRLQDLDLIVASDCIWLASLLDSLFDTVAAIFAAKNASSGETATATTRTPPRSPTLLLAFQRRDQNVGSALFTTVERMVQVVEERYQWKLSTIAWRPVTLVDGTETDVRVVQIQP